MVWADGTQLNGGRYTIERVLGRGRFGITYLARDKQDKRVVIKTLSDALLNSSDAERLQQLFVKGAVNLAKCKHPHIVEVKTPFQEGGVVCVAMEYIDGMDLGSRAEAILPEAEALQYIRQIGEALIEVHKNKLLHCDIRPGNILLRAGKAEAVLIDFDFAMDFDHEFTVTRTGELKKGFAPLELSARSAQRGPYTDIYSLGATLYVLLTGKMPVSADERKIDIDNKSPDPLVAPKDYSDKMSRRVNKAILSAMKLEGEDRPQSVEEWLEDLGLQKESNSTDTTSSRSRQVNWNLEKIAAIATCVGTLVTLFAFCESRKDTDSEERQPSPAIESPSPENTP